MKKVSKTFLFVLLCLVALRISCDLISSHYERKYYHVEYASQTNENFYHKMVDMKVNSQMTFNGFPTCLTSVLKSSPGDEVLFTEADTLYFVYSNLNDEDLNKYPFYIIMDNHDNAWSIYRHNEEFHLIREDGIKLKKLL